MGNDEWIKNVEVVSFRNTNDIWLRLINLLKNLLQNNTGKNPLFTT